MPELPEVETVVRELKSCEGDMIVSAKVYWHRSVIGAVKTFEKKLGGQKILTIRRRGKYICLELGDGSILTVHLRMTGKLVFEPNAKDQMYIRVSLKLKKSGELHFVDVRKFGKLKLWPEQASLLPELGPEPLDENTVFNALSSLTSKRPIKSILLDQKVLAGIGNIYADEALHMAGLHPLYPGHRLQKKKVQLLSSCIPTILKRSIQNMGTTLSDYRTTKNIGGENQKVLQVYGQTGRECRKCSSMIRRIVVGGRSTHFCSRCQRSPRI